MATRRAPTITDVARLAGVAVGTVSNVLNGTVPVGGDRRDRVLAAVAQLGYRPNMLAQGLRRRRSPVVGICVPRTSVAYFAALVEAFEEIASDGGYHVMHVLTHDAAELERQRVASLLRYHVGGVVLVPGAEPAPTLDMLAQSDTPVVVVDRTARGYGFDEVTFDNRAAMRDATERLIGLGHRRLLFVVRRRKLVVTQQRIQGMRQAVRGSGAEVSAEILECAEEQELRTRLAVALTAVPRPTAVIVSNSTFAAAAMRAIRAMKLRCPDDVSLLAFDEPEWAELVSPTLSVVRQPTRDIARMAWELLLRRMRGGADQRQQVELKAQVVLRDSVARPPLASKRARQRGG
ncbi:LacI family DNA-binding transcriptional regulator [Falsiroseomonas bella]|nr:LacI family DNA-binding transcriptional regulator [Falsiroseomonas bella]